MERVRGFSAPQAPAGLAARDARDREELRGQTALAVCPGPRNEASLWPLGPQPRSSEINPRGPPFCPQGTLPPSRKILLISLLTPRNYNLR